MTRPKHKNQKKHQTIDGVECKHCYSCDTWKALSDFNKSKSIWDGLDRKCRVCCKEYRERNKERLQAKKKEYRDANKEKITEYKKDNKERYAEYNKNYQERYRKENKEVLKEYFKEYYQRNKTEINKKVCERIRNSTELRLLRNLRSRMYYAVRYTGKSETTKELLGCTSSFLRKYLEKQFVDDMTWENYGPEWHVDHIRPCDSFDLTDVKQQQKCFHYTNLQPMWGSENCSKGCKWNPPELVFIESPIYYH